jgi:hypothetical protein
MSVFKTGGPSAPTSLDPYKSSNSILLRCEGTDGAQVFTDEMGLCTATSIVGVTTSTAQKKYGNSSILSPDSTSAALEFNGSPGYFNTGQDFTIEFWVRFTTLTTYTCLAGTNNGSGGANTWFIEWSSSRGFGYWSDSGGPGFNKFVDPSSPSTGVWYHIAVTRSSNIVRGFIDGVLQATSFTDGALYNKSVLAVGGYTAGASRSQNLVGNIDDFRITKGVARYTSTFTPLQIPVP